MPESGDVGLMSPKDTEPVPALGRKHWFSKTFPPKSPPESPPEAKKTAILSNPANGDETFSEKDFPSEQIKTINGNVDLLAGYFRLEIRGKDLSPQQLRIVGTLGDIKETDLARVDPYRLRSSLNDLVVSIRSEKIITPSLEAPDNSMSPECVTVLLLALWESNKKDLPPETQGKKIDVLLLLLRYQSTFLKLGAGEIVGLTKELNLICDQEVPGLPHFVRETLAIQTLQMAACNNLGVRKTVGEVFRDGPLGYPSEKLELLLGSLPENSPPEDIFSLILVLTSPYKCSLGKSKIGVENLRKLIADLSRAKELSVRLPEGSDLKALAERVIYRQMYHCTAGKIPAKFMDGFSQGTKDDCRRYQEFRLAQPLWYDRLAIYRDFANYELLSKFENYKTEEKAKVVVGLSTGSLPALAILKSGEYWSLHEMFNGNGCTDLNRRAIRENRLFLLTTGTPDDPYPRYGALHLWNRESFEIVNYGNYTFILKDGVRRRVSVTQEDSFNTDHLPVVEPSIQEKMEIDRCGFQRYIFGSNYVESQIHGDLRVSDFTALVFTGDKEYESIDVLQQITELCEKHGLEFIDKSSLPE